MNIILTNAAEAGMPEDMIANCKTLIERRIQKKFGGTPTPGADVTILYSEKDPLGTTNEVDDHAYDIYFTVESVEAPKGGDPNSGTVKVQLMM